MTSPPPDTSGTAPTVDPQAPEAIEGLSRSGVLMAIGAYTWWGLTTLYWPLTHPATTVEALFQRIVWSMLVLVVVLAVLRRWAWIRPVLASPRQMVLLAIAAVLVGTNWGIFIWATSNDRVLDASLGYFINPLVSVALGVAVLRERLDAVQRLAIAIAVVGVAWLTWQAGAPPWVGLILAGTFGLYGLSKKTSGLGALEGLAAETAVLTPLAVVVLGILAARGDLVFGTAGAGNAALLAGAGVVTVVPLLAFAGGVRRIPLATVGVLHYLTPTVMFVIGVAGGREDVSAGRLAGFALIWLACAIFALGSQLRRSRGRHTPVPG